MNYYYSATICKPTIWWRSYSITNYLQDATATRLQWIVVSGNAERWAVEFVTIIQTSDYDVCHSIIGKTVQLMDIGEDFGMVMFYVH